MPLNIFVCILSLVAILSLYFAPFIKVDIGKILRQEETIELLDKYMDEAVGSGLGDDSPVDFVPVVSSVVKEVVSNVNGTITFSALKVTQFALAQTNDKLGLIVDDIMDGVVPELISSVASSVTGLFKAEGGNKAIIEDVIEDAVVNTLVSSLGNVLPEDEAAAIQEKLTPERVTELKTTFNKINDVKSEDDVVEVVDEFIGQVTTILGENYISVEDEQTVKDFVVELYNDTMEEIAKTEGAEFSMEAMICVAVQNNVDLGEIDIGKMLDEFLGQTSGEDKAPSKKALAADGDEPAPEKSPSLTYGDLLGEIGLNEDKIDEISEKLTTVLKTTVDDSIGGVKESLEDLSEGEFGWVYDNIYWLLLAVMMIFAVPWFFLALISLIRIFTKNKRFTMWYVKLFCFIPALISLVILLAPVIMPRVLPLFITEAEAAAEALSYANIALAGVTSFTWISGLCYVALWLVSIFWAFPIKHKIRKERKACKRAKKNGTYRYDEYEDEFGHAVTPENTNGFGETAVAYGSTDGRYDNTDYGNDSASYGDDDDDGFESSYTYEDYDDPDDEF